MKTTFTLMCGVMLVAMAFPAHAETPISLRQTVEVRDEKIRLSDVFTGVPTETDRDIAIAPEPGKSVTYDVRVLTRLAEQYRLNWRPLSHTDMTTLTRAASFITPDMVQAAVSEKLKETGLDASAPHEIVLDNRALSLALPAGKEPTFHLRNFSYDKRSHRFKSELIAQGETKELRQPVSGRVLVKRQVPVLIKRLQAGTIIGASDLDWITMAEDQLGADVLVSQEQLIGQEVRHDQAEQIVLRSRDIVPPRLVVRGNLVTMRIETPLMLISAQGRALQDGAKGQVVRLKNTQSDRIVEGIVESNGTVRIQMDSMNKLANAS